MTPRTHGATAARRIPDPKVGGSNPSGFIPLPPELRWQSGRLLTDRSLVRSQVVAIPFATDAIFFFVLVPTPSTVDVPVAQLDKASDYESEDWGFKSLQGYQWSTEPPWPNG